MNNAKLTPTVILGHVRMVETDGSGLIEFALAMPVLLAVIFGMMECCLGLYVEHFVTNASREGTRYAAVRGSSWTGTPCATTTSVDCVASAANVTAYVQSMVPGGVKVSSLTVTTTWSGTNVLGQSCLAAGAANSPGCLVTVKTSYSFPFSVPFVPTSTWTLSSQSTLTIVQ